MDEQRVREIVQEELAKEKTAAGATAVTLDAKTFAESLNPLTSTHHKLPESDQ